MPVLDILKNKKIQIVAGIVIFIFLAAVAVQKFSSFDPLKMAWYYLSGDYKAQYYKISPEHFPGSAQTAENKLSISIRESKFLPNANLLPPGATVIWTNDDKIVHNVTGENWSSGDLEPGESFSKTFDKAGDYNYHYSIHPEMTGFLKIQ